MVPSSERRAWPGEVHRESLLGASTRALPPHASARYRVCRARRVATAPFALVATTTVVATARRTVLGLSNDDGHWRTGSTQPPRRGRRGEVVGPARRGKVVFTRGARPSTQRHLRTTPTRERAPRRGVTARGTRRANRDRRRAPGVPIELDERDDPLHRSSARHGAPALESAYTTAHEAFAPAERWISLRLLPRTRGHH